MIKPKKKLIKKKQTKKPTQLTCQTRDKGHETETIVKKSKPQ